MQNLQHTITSCVAYGVNFNQPKEAHLNTAMHFHVVKPSPPPLASGIQGSQSNHFIPLLQGSTWCQL